MNKFARKLLTSALALTVAFSVVTPITAEAAISVPKEVSLYRTSKDATYTTYTTFYIDGVKKNTSIPAKSFKSTNKNIVEPYRISKSSSSYENTYLDGTKPNKSQSYSAWMDVKIKKAGTATLKYKIDNKDYETKVIARPYENPIKTANIANIKKSGKTDLASLTKTQNSANIKLTQTKKNATVKFSAQKNWKISSIEVYDSVSGNTYAIRNYGTKGVSNVAFNVGTLTKNKYARVELYVTNTKNNGSFWVYYYIN